MPIWPSPFTCEGNFVKIEPLTQSHHNGLCEAVSDGNLNELWYTSIPSADAMMTEIDRRISLETMLPFTILEKTTGKVLGMTTYMNIDETNRRLEIGSTWYRNAAQRTPTNTECKLLLLSHAFEALDCICVEFRTHFLNTQSRRAIERLGAKLDGVLRSNAIMSNGTIRDTAVYSNHQSDGLPFEGDFSGS
ncbi:UNVERIFIED_CONTAM: hypothetical protein GTU68_031382 [Idotea baltica]|nr:hypothetical protein [Idotea baltica]